MNLFLEKKVFLVAGASQGLGFGIAGQLLHEGAKVSIASSDDKRIQLAKTALDAGDDCLAVACDVTDPAAIQHWVDKTVTHFGRLDGIVVNAGGPKPGTFDDFNDEDWLRAFNLTLMSAVRMIRAVLPVMREQQSGVILTLTSRSVKEPIDFLLLSNVMRSGVTSLAKTLSEAEAKHGIRVNNLVPGLIATDRLKTLEKSQADINHRSIEEQHAMMVSSIPMQRYGQTDEFAKAATFLLSDAASYITGSTLVVDGGTMKTVW